MIGRHDLLNMSPGFGYNHIRICSDHFKPTDFNRNNRLSYNANPTLDENGYYIISFIYPNNIK